jgi:hypothetical protein
MENNKGLNTEKQCATSAVVSRLVCPNNEQHIVKKEGVGKYCMVCGLLK